MRANRDRRDDPRWRNTGARAMCQQLVVAPHRWWRRGIARRAATPARRSRGRVCGNARRPTSAPAGSSATSALHAASYRRSTTTDAQQGSSRTKLGAHYSIQFTPESLRRNQQIHSRGSSLPPHGMELEIRAKHRHSRRVVFARAAAARPALHQRPALRLFQRAGERRQRLCFERNQRAGTTISRNPQSFSVS